MEYYIKNLANQPQNCKPPPIKSINTIRFHHQQIIKKQVENIPMVDLGIQMASIPNCKLLALGSRELENWVSSPRDRRIKSKHH